MKRVSRWLLVVLLCLGPVGALFAEKVSDLPAPAGYVNDFAHVLSPQTVQSLDNLCWQLDQRAHAQVAVVTIKTLDDDQSIDEFTSQLEEKWKVGTKRPGAAGAESADRGVLMVIATQSHRDRIEVGYGLEGILNDAKVGDIRRAMTPAAHQGDFNSAVTLGVQQLAQVIATDAGVTLATPQPRQYSPYQQQPMQIQISPWQVLVVGAVLLLIVIVLIATGNIGLLWMLLSMFMGGGGGGSRGRDDDRFGGGGGGFGGFGGGSSGGGGASGDF